ncbi:hypothetical protein AGOR_G00080320 [Albula goreensis]|uniref:ILEI/PANDER domain-containing protein n=1 Tax=Albula goreensis TaxID=1534307 RepID=A0A8T3DI19_9TELE|nr:hypothetical protein AGOR_G00080320 [Albula goreensis]
MRPRDIIQLVMVLTAILVMVYIATNPPHNAWKRAQKIRDIFGSVGSKKDQLMARESTAAILYKCGLPKKCPVNQFAFLIRSGAANVIGPKICFDGQVIMSSVKNNIGSGLNIALINVATGKVEKIGDFNMYSGDVKELLKFMKDIKPGTVVLVASYDEPATKMTDELRAMFVSLGSSMIKSVGFRDGWVFAGAVGIKQKTPFERHIKNDKAKNVYDGWPEMLEMGGCIPRRL